MYVNVLLLFRFTGRKRRPGPTSTLWIVAFANRTVAPGESGRETGDDGGDVDSESVVRPGTGDIRGDLGDSSGLIGCPDSETGEAGKEGICLGGGLLPSGLETLSIDLGIGEVGRCGGL